VYGVESIEEIIQVLKDNVDMYNRVHHGVR